MKSFWVLFKHSSPSTFFCSKFTNYSGEVPYIPCCFTCFFPATFLSLFFSRIFLCFESLYLSVPSFVEKYFSSLFQIFFRHMKAYLISLFLLEPYSIKYPLLFGVLRKERLTSVSTLSCFNKNGSIPLPYF